VVILRVPVEDELTDLLHREFSPRPDLGDIERVERSSGGLLGLHDLDKELPSSIATLLDVVWKGEREQHKRMHVSSSSLRREHKGNAMMSRQLTEEVSLRKVRVLAALDEGLLVRKLLDSLLALPVVL
jgi:hypothetical protein